MGNWEKRIEEKKEIKEKEKVSSAFSLISPLYFNHMLDDGKTHDPFQYQIQVLFT